MNQTLVLDNLELALELAAVFLAAPAADSELADDLRGLVGAMHLLVRRYRDSIIEATDPTGR